MENLNSNPGEKVTPENENDIEKPLKKDRFLVHDSTNPNENRDLFVHESGGETKDDNNDENSPKGRFFISESSEPPKE